MRKASNVVKAGRRLVLGAVPVLLTCALRAHGQAASSRRVAFLSGSTQTDTAVFFASFLDGLRTRGYRDGENIVVDARFADYSAEQAKALADAIAVRNPAVIVATGGGIAPACGLNPPFPVVFIHSGDPVDAGFADSFARPGRNATGVSLLALDLIPKRMELLREFRPDLRRIALLCSPEHAGQRHELAAAKNAAAQLRMEVTYHEARNPQELAQILPDVVAARPDAALLFSDALMVGQRHTLATFFLKHRIPSVAGWSAFPDSGHLMSYGPERHVAWRRMAYFVDRILRGARPSDLPIELPTAIELVVNRRTAGAMNLPLPPALLARADRVVDAPAAS